MIEIPLSGRYGLGKTALIDDEDFHLVSRYKWHAHNCGGAIYVRTAKVVMGRQRITLLHRLIAGATPSYLVDHKNGDTLDNRRFNLRLCGKSENGVNRHRKQKSVSGCRYVGVYLNKQIGKWQAYFDENYIGVFDTQEAASEAHLFARYHPNAS